MVQPLPAKEQSLFRHVVQGYESKQYKKGLKAADQVLRKFPDHGDTQAMKALILNSQGKTDEAFELAKLALRNAMKSHICWHVYGLLWRSAKNYEEAIKAYKFALRLEPESLQIQRDLAMLQIQMRDYEGYTQSRKTMLQARPGLRQNWTALAIAHHLEGDLDAAETLLTTYEETLKVKPSKADTEHAGAVIYKNSIIAELGDIEQALQHLKSIYTTHPDRAELMLRKGRYLLALERNKEAETVYRNLIRRNPDRREYYHDLEKAMGLDRNDKTHHQSLLDLYNTFIQASSRPDTPQRIPLDFLIGDHFRQSSDRYLRRMLNKGVPSTFATIKALYNDTERLHTIQDLVEGYVVDGKTDGSADATDTSDSWQLAVHYFLAQHYNYHVSRNLTKAFEHIEKAMALNKDKTEYSYVMTKARIWKHSGNTARASQIMNDARELDLKDRYIATKCAKYQLRNTEPEKALKTMGLFTRDKAAGGPLGDLVDMQDVMYLYEDAMAYHRLGKDNLALKRLHTNIDVFETIHEDQFDFHNFSLRKGQIDVYVDLVRWEDHLRDHPWYATSALAAIKIYLSLHDKMASASSAPTNGSAEDSAERKRAAKKARKEAEKARDEAKAAAAAKATVGPDGDVVKPDEDPHGFKLLDTKDPIGEAIKLLQPLLSLAPQYIEASLAGFEVMSRANKYLAALKCLLTALDIDSENPTLHKQIMRFHTMIAKLPEDMNASSKFVLDSLITRLPAREDMPAYNEAFLSKHDQSPAHVHAALAVRHMLNPDSRSSSETTLVESAQLPSASLKDAVAGRELLSDWHADAMVVERYTAAAHERWPEATAFA